MELTHDSVTEHVIIREVLPGRIRHWLQLALEDLQRASADALFYGAIFVLMGYAATGFFSATPLVVLILSSLFLLTGPFMAIGLYDLARQREGIKRHGQVSLWRSLLAWRHNLQGISLYAAMLAVLAFCWFRLSLLLFTLFFGAAMLPSLGDILLHLSRTPNAAFLLSYFAAGLLFALVAFVASVIAVPMMLDKEVDTMTAMLISLRVVQKNIKTMTWWAAIIVVLTGIGLATYLIGLVFTMPLIALASWHAYRDTVSYQY
ncbi:MULTISPECIES: DUF2189 domain-containing protein [unclassified Paludibacterium]|uniref:DUF2189 domain-containing protein n=1 Tax=unclassified Paludibacterium TaxID=2618429 RepID=UPI001C049D7F|nr:DUF2189 domain-containing protein [Paludibacterium sp. B53371]BEV73381.1 DUF2189 domain-containing protein [Paludibacterium sp. THUN1379]